MSSAEFLLVLQQYNNGRPISIAHLVSYKPNDMAAEIEADFRNDAEIPHRKNAIRSNLNLSWKNF
jgi:hypothetical protein